MNVTVEYSFRHPAALGRLASEINEGLGCNLAAKPGRESVVSGRFLGMRLSLSAAGPGGGDPTPDAAASSYRLTAIGPEGNEASRTLQLPVMAAIAYVLHHGLGIAGVLTYNRERLLARYEERRIGGHGRRLYDVVSGTPFTDFPIHLAVLLRALSDSPRNEAVGVLATSRYV